MPESQIVPAGSVSSTRSPVTRAGQVFVVPFALLRLPLSVVDRTVRKLLPPRSRGRTAFDHGLGVMDHWAGLVLDDQGIARSGQARIARAGVFEPGSEAQVPSLTGTTTYAVTRPSHAAESAAGQQS
jgi:hypothetical protein